MTEVKQARCGRCGVVYSERAFPRHEPDGVCLRPEGLGLAYGPAHVWVLPDEIVVKATCPRCGVTFSKAAHDAHFPEGASPPCPRPETLGLVLADGCWQFPPGE